MYLHIIEVYIYHSRSVKVAFGVALHCNRIIAKKKSIDNSHRRLEKAPAVATIELQRVKFRLIFMN